MGCHQAKSIRNKRKSGQEAIVADIIQVIDELDSIKEKYMNRSSDDSLDGCSKKIMSIEDFLLSAYRTNRFSKEQLQSIYLQVRAVFSRVESLLAKVRLELLNNQSLKPDVEEVFTDFTSIFTTITQRILAMPAISFDSYNYQIKKCIASPDSQSVFGEDDQHIHQI